jgi:uncharacterized protein YkwD
MPLSRRPAGPGSSVARRLRSAFARRLSPVLVLAVLAGAASLLAAPTGTFAWEANSFASASESQLYALTNQARASADLPALRTDAALASIARYRSRDMEDRGYFSHTIPPSGNMVWDVMDARGYCYKIAGENIGWNTYPDEQATAEIETMFMDSPGHRENIVGRTWNVIGIGAYKGSDGHMMWTVLFVDRTGCSSPAPAMTPTSTRAPTPSPTRNLTLTSTAIPVRTPVPTPQPTSVPTPQPTLDPSARPAS